MVEIKNGEWNSLPCGGAVLLDAEGKPERLSDGGLDLEERAIRREAEALLGVWIDVGEWSDPAAGEDDATSPCSLSDEQPTHRIVFTDGRGEKTTDLVYLHEEGEAYSHDEWDDADSAAWGVVDGVWLCQGQATPGGQNGTVEVCTLVAKRERGLERAANKIDATSLPGGRWIYLAEETGSWWVVTSAELADLGERMDRMDEDDTWYETYSLWCSAWSGVEIRVSQVEALRNEAAVAGDLAMVEACRAALEQDDDALERVATAILETRAAREERGGVQERSATSAHSTGAASTIWPDRLREEEVLMSYTRPERRRLEALLVRATHIAGRIARDGEERHTFERAELGALRWAVDQIVAARGALPEDLERLRAGLC